VADEILQEPHPLLRQVSAAVTDFSAVPALVARMRAAMRASPVHALGLAAVQIGELRRVIVVVQGGHDIVMVNPVINAIRGIQTVKDGCLSVRGGRYLLSRTRPRWLLVEYRDERGEPQCRRAERMHAAAIAHEIDHLDGVLFTDQKGKTK
jgi:peptide deformylase